jgi:regulator of replication initiation timing
MMPNEVTQLRTMAEMNRRLRRENDRLRESLLMESKERKTFDNENVELFDVVHRNHAVRG